METAYSTTVNEKKQVQQLYQQLLECWNNSDAHGYAALFDEECSVIGFDGSQMNGKSSIASELSRIFKDHRVASYIYDIEETRSIGNCAYLLRAVVGMISPGGEDIIPDRNAIQSMIAIKKDDKFLITLFQNTPAAFHGRPEESKRLTERLQEKALKKRQR